MGDKKNLIQLSSPTGWKHNSPINHKKIISNIPGQNITLHENNFKYIRDKLDVHGDACAVMQKLKCDTTLEGPAGYVIEKWDCEKDLGVWMVSSTWGGNWQLPIYCPNISKALN